MPANQRQTYKRELERAIGNIEWAIHHLAPMAETYRSDHPEITAPIEGVAAGLIIAQEALAEIEKML